MARIWIKSFRRFSRTWYFSAVSHPEGLRGADLPPLKKVAYDATFIEKNNVKSFETTGLWPRNNLVFEDILQNPMMMNQTKGLEQSTNQIIVILMQMKLQLSEVR